MKRFLCTLLLASLSLTTRAITLDQVLARTLEKNPQIEQARSGLQAAAGQRLILRSTALPQFLVGTIAGVQGGQRATTSSAQPFVFAYGAFAQPLFHAGIPASYRRGEVDLLIAEQQLNVAIVGELHQARLAFYSALYNRALESLGRSQRERLEQNIAGEKARYEAGNTDRGAFTAATLLARELDPKIESAHRAYGGALLQLAQSMGSSLGREAALPQPEGTLTFQAIEPRAEKAAADALQRRADLKLARLMVRAAREDQRIVAAGYYPAVDAVASGEAIPVSGIHRDDHGSPEATENTVASEVRGGVAYTWRVVDNGQVGGAVLSSRATRETNELELRKLEASIPRELGRLQNNLHAIDARYRSLSQAANAAEQTVTSVQENRAQGLASVLDFRTAETDLLATRSGILSAVYAQQVALAEWDRATGRYFQFSDDTVAKVH
jgi:outer membrane protein TolC